MPVKLILHLIFAVNQRSSFYTVGDQSLWTEKGRTENIFKWEENEEKNLTAEGPEAWDHH